VQLTATQRLEFGGEVTRQEFRPGKITPAGDTLQLRPREVEPRFGNARAAYLGHEIDIGTRAAIRYGVRWAGFDRVGAGTRYRYVNNAPVIYNAALGRFEPGRLLDSSRVAAGSTISSFSGWEPRASLRLSINDRQSIKTSYSRTQQFLQLISNTNSPTPLDVWEPVGPFIKPQVANQYAVGWAGQWRSLELTAETYYKTATGTVDYIDGADVILNPRLETILIQGLGRAYGLELYARRTTGRLTGWVSYTLARSEQRFPAPGNAGSSVAGGINEGRWYPSPFDKTHNLSIAGVWQWTPKWSVGSTFLLASGLPTTLPRSRYVVDDFLVAEYGPRNSSRLPLYHRLDLNLTRTLRRGELQFGALNLYNRFNAQALRVRQQTRNPLVAEAVQTSIFGIVPSINYVFRF
jgi:outer membrane receptor protein involved in Fe transport